MIDAIGMYPEFWDDHSFCSSYIHKVQYKILYLFPWNSYVSFWTPDSESLIPVTPLRSRQDLASVELFLAVLHVIYMNIGADIDQFQFLIRPDLGEPVCFLTLHILLYYNLLILKRPCICSSAICYFLMKSVPWQNCSLISVLQTLKLDQPFKTPRLFV